MKKVEFTEVYEYLFICVRSIFKKYTWLSSVCEPEDLVHDIVERWLRRKVFQELTTLKNYKAFIRKAVLNWVFDKHNGLTSIKRGGKFNRVDLNLEYLSDNEEAVLPSHEDYTDVDILIAQLVSLVSDTPSSSLGISKRRVLLEHLHGRCQKDIARRFRASKTTINSILKASFQEIRVRAPQTAMAFRDERWM